METKEYPLISIIVPVYNVERYLRRCVESILAQVYKNIEIILVNDGSTDNSWAICQEYESSYPSIIAVSKQNGGLSSARNYGINFARGKYVGFIDSDDWISPDMFMTLYELIHTNNADAAQINFMLADNENVKRSENNETITILQNRNEILYNYLKEGTTGTGAYTVWRCLFPLELAKKYKFREGKINEDIDYKYKVLGDCVRFAISDKICYYYFQSGFSISSGKLRPRDFDLYDSANELEKLTNIEADEGIRFLGKVKKARTPFSLLCRIAYYGISDSFEDKKAIIKKLVYEHRHNVAILLKAPLPLSRKILTVLFGISFPATRALIRMMKSL